MTIATLDSYLDLAIDVAEGLGASSGLLLKMASYRKKGRLFLRDMAQHFESNGLGEGDSETSRLAFILYNLLEDDGLVYVHESRDFPENIVLNLMDHVLRFGYRWEPENFDPNQPLTVRLVDPSALEIGRAQSAPPSDADTEELFATLADLIRRSELGVYEIPILADQSYHAITRKKSFDTLARRYSQNWKTIFSLQDDWSAVSPVVPPK